MTNFKTSAKLMAGVALVASANLASAMVVNGSFEAAATAGGTPGVGAFRSLALGNTDMPSWTVISDSIAWIHGPISAGIGLLTAQQGEYFLDLTDTSLSSPFGGVTQAIATTAGQQYTLNFYLGTSQFYNPLNGSSALLSIAGNNFTVSSTVTTAPNSWELKTVTFTALGATTVLGFQGIAGQDYIGLDNISVTAVPEPSSLAMLFAGLAAVGSVVARRRINPS
jgi:Protein of unknown function (DUF642)/PEP-CTERM motif